MIFAEFSQLAGDNFDLGIDQSLTIQDFQSKCAVDNLVALKLTSVSPKYTPGEIIPVRNAAGQPLADLFIGEGQPFGYGQASAHQVAAYLEELNYGVALARGQERRDYVFTHSYVLVDVANYGDYIQNYREGSGIWGHFVHVEQQTSKTLPYRPLIQQITARPNLDLSRAIVKDATFRAVAHASPLERFLKLYHLLEIDFDVQIVEQINALGADLKGIGKILKSFSGDKEFDRLLKLVRQASSTDAFFVGVLTDVLAAPTHHAQLAEMLFEYSKEWNPYKLDAPTFLTLIAGGFDVQSFRGAGLNANYDHLTKFTAYIIYRFRCSIAHVKIGEYMLTTDDEPLICAVAEPLVVAILSALYNR